MPESGFTINGLLGLPSDGLPQQMLTAGVSQQELNSLRTQIASTLKGMQWQHLEQTVCAKFTEQLNRSPLELMAEAWSKYQVLTESAEQSKSGEAVFVPLEEHSITSELHPYVVIQLGPQELKRIELDVTLTLQLQGLILKIEAGKIKSVEAGSCQGSGEIEIKGISVWKHDFQPIQLPGKVALGDGIAIH